MSDLRSATETDRDEQLTSGPIDRCTPDEREVLARHLNIPRDKFFGPRRRWGFTLFLLGERPACRLISTQQLVSERGVAECRTRPEAFTKCDYIGQLLREVDVPFCQVVPRPEDVPDESLTVKYYVATDPDRFGLLPDPYRTPADESVPAESVQIGRFLGYPEDAVAACPARECDKGAWLNALAPSEIETAAGHLLDEVLIPEGMPRYVVLERVLPYLPPRPADGPPELHLANAIRYLAAGLRGDREYGIRTLAFLLGD